MLPHLLQHLRRMPLAGARTERFDFESNSDSSPVAKSRFFSFLNFFLFALP